MRLYTLISAFIVSLSMYSADYPKDMGVIIVNSLHLEQQGDSLYIDIDAELNYKVAAWDGLLITPVLAADKILKEFDSSFYKGSAFYIVGSRDGSNGYDTFKWNKGKKGYKFSAVVHFEDWMRNAELIILLSEGTLCSKSPDLVKLVNLGKAKLVVPPPYNPSWRVAFISPPTEEIKDRDVSGEAFLDFAVGKSVLQADFRRNAEELAKITKVINELRSNNDVTITGITITGYASLDGKEIKNRQIATSRANALKEYLVKTCQLSDKELKVVGYGEDWETFKTLISNSELSDKESILAIADEKESGDQREYKLRTLGKGIPYKNILRDIYPKLRRVSYQINYKVREFKLEEAKLVLKSRPAQLSLNEMFTVANAYPLGSADFFEVFDIAVRLFPDNEVANANAAAVALQKNDMESVMKYMSKISSADAAIINNNGVISAKNGDYAKALDDFSTANAAGLVEAKHNLNELMHLRDVERIIRETIEENKGR